MDDLLSTFNLLPNKIHLWQIMRYVSVIFRISYGLSIEIHTPRNTNELFTYYSDKYWAKIIYGLSTNYSTKTMLQKIFDGSVINLKQYWYPILLQNRYLSRNSIKYEIGYYLHNTDYLFIDEKQREEYKIISKENKILSEVLNYVINIKTIKKNDCIHLLRFFCKYSKLDDNIIEIFYQYIIAPETDPCSECENREDIIVLLENYM